MRFKAILLLSTLAFAGSAYCDSFTATYLAAGVQTPTGVTSYYDSFDSITPGTSGSYTTTFNGSGITGTYSGGVQWYGANEYGGAGGTGTYAETFTSYTLSLSSSVNYFGLWFSALDAGNKLSFYNGSTLVYSFTPADFIGLVGSCPGTGFCGNPNSNFKGQDGAEQFAYLNFYDLNGSFNKIVFAEVSGSGGFESDNHAVAALSTVTPTGTVITPTPEPSSMGLLGLALASAGLIWRRKKTA